jgi:hypothetical protein
MGVWRYPDCVVFRSGRDAGRLLKVHQGAGGGEPVLDAQALAGLVQVRVDGVLGDVQLTGDLLGRKVAIDEAEALPLPRRQLTDTLDRPLLTHKMS